VTAAILSFTAAKRRRSLDGLATDAIRRAACRPGVRATTIAIRLGYTLRPLFATTCERGSSRALHYEWAADEEERDRRVWRALAGMLLSREFGPHDVADAERLALALERATLDGMGGS
jgi:hypothetical protein